MIIIILLIFIAFFVVEPFVVFNDYKVPNPGYCKSPIPDKLFKEGRWDTYCWGEMGQEDCELLNNNGYNCGRDLKTGEILPCVYKYGKCKDDVQCYSSCYDMVGLAKGPYMIKVESNNLIGLNPAL